ncbi:type II toxin-antitoxin system VapC family toxin [candidate division WOR-3 bacterium]|nr:type II toxin-antitoxin system VapC family toxin [candidate division WOR-3 bacterium]
MFARKLLIYADASAIGGCEDDEFKEDSRALWERFRAGQHMLVLSEHTIRELMDAPPAVRSRITEIPREHQVVLPDQPEADALAQAYLSHGALGPGSYSDALHIALATIRRVDILVSWNFRHIVNFGRIRLFNAVNIEEGFGTLEIRTPKEVLDYE